MNDLLLGVIAMASFAAGLFFLRFWRSSRDRFFLFFALAFWIEAVNRLMLSILHPLSEEIPIFYFVRFLAFGLILYAVIEKNFPKKK